MGLASPKTILRARDGLRLESRDPSGTPVVTGRLTAREIRGRATAVNVGDMRTGKVDAGLKADVVADGGEATALRIEKLGH